MTEHSADAVRLLREALPHVESHAEAWNDWQGEEDNLRRQRAAWELALQIRAHIDGSTDASRESS